MDNLIKTFNQALIIEGISMSAFAKTRDIDPAQISKWRKHKINLTPQIKASIFRGWKSPSIPLELFNAHIQDELGIAGISLRIKCLTINDTKDITIIAATMNEAEDRFTESALEKLAESAVGVPVTMNFDANKIIGKVNAAKVTKQGLEISASLSEDFSGMFLVPGYQLPDYKSVTFGIVAAPQDKTLPKIK